MTIPLDYLDYYQKGLESYRGGHYEQALISLKKSLLLQPDFPDPYFAIARVYTELRRHGDAVSIYEKLCDLLPNDLEVRCSLASELLKCGSERKAVWLLKKILRLNPNDTAARTVLLRHYLDTGKLRRALRAAKRGIKVLPEHVPFHYMAGETCLRMQKLDKAQEFYERCLDLNPNHEPAKRGLNAVIRALEEPGGGPVRRSPEDEARGELIEAATLYRAGDYDRAIDILRRLLDRPGAERDAAMLLGHSFVKKGLFKRARDVLVQFASSHEPDIMVLYNLGLASNRMGRYAEAMDYLEQTLTMDEEFTEALTEMGIACMMTGEPALARDFLVRAVKTGKTNPRPYAYLGRLAYNAGDRDKAVQFLRKAKALEPECIDIALNLGYIALRNGQYRDAAKHLEECLKRSPDHFEAHKLNGLARMNMESHALALESFRSALTLNPSDEDSLTHSDNLTAQLTA